MQKIVLFVEPNDDAFLTPSKIGNLFMNRFAIDETVRAEISNIFEFQRTSVKMSLPTGDEYENFVDERKQKGMDCIYL